MIARYPGICGCCSKRFPAGAVVHRAFGDSYVHEGCLRRVPAPPQAPTYADEVRDTLERAKAAQAKADAAEKAGGRR